MIRRAVVPPIFRDDATLSDRVRTFFELVERRLGFELVWADSLPPSAVRADVIMVYAGAHGRRAAMEAVGLPKGIRVIYLLTGPHNFRADMFERIFERADLALCTYAAYMRTHFKQFNNRWRFFPLYFAPHGRYARLRVRKRPVMKCLFTGHVNPKLYPLRHYVLQQLPRQQRWEIDRMLHPRWEQRGQLLYYEVHACVNEEYAWMLNAYWCSLATASVYRYGLAKYYEIPAAGTLLLAERAHDVYEAGLRAEQHYVPISAKNVLAQVHKCCTEPELFDGMRREATDYVRTHHSVNNRVAQLKAMLEEL